jgi:hypothetical protein
MNEKLGNSSCKMDKNNGKKSKILMKFGRNGYIMDKNL